MTNFVLPKETLFDVSGDPIVNGSVEFYLTGTNTPTPVFADKELTIPLGTVVFSDGAGRIPSGGNSIYLDPEITYKVVFKDASSSVVYTKDPHEPLALGGTAVSDRLKQVASNPLDYGAIGDGVADESVPVQMAVDNATYTVDLLGKTYRCDSTINVPANRRMINGTLDFGNLVGTAGVRITGGSVAAALPLTAQADYSTSVITVASTGTLQAGDYLLLATNVAWASGVQTAEMVRIATVTSGTQVTLDARTNATYAAGVSSISKLTLAENVRFENLTVFSSGVPLAVGFDVTLCNRVRFDNVVARRFNGAGLAIISSNDVDAYGLISKDNTSTGVSVSGYARGVSFVSPDISNNSFSGITIGNTHICKNVSVIDARIYGCNTVGIFVQRGAFMTSIIGGRILGDSRGGEVGISDQGTSTSVSGVTIRHMSSSGILIVPLKTATFTAPSPPFADDSYSIIEDCRVEFCNVHGIQFSSVAAGAVVDRVVIHNNNIRAVGSRPIFINTSPGFPEPHTIDVTDNDVADMGSHGIYISPGTTSRVNVTGNSVSNVTAPSFGIYVIAPAQCVIDGNNVSSSGVYPVGIAVDAAASAVITDNFVQNAQTAYRYVSGGDASVVIDSNIASDYTANLAYVLFSGTNIGNVNISGNTQSGAVVATGGILVEAQNTAQIRGTFDTNTIKSTTTTGVEVRALAAGVLIGNVSLAHNSINSPGTAGIRLASASVGGVASISQNSIVSPTADGIVIENIGVAVFSGNSVFNSGSTAILCNYSVPSLFTGAVTFANNVVSAPLGDGITLRATGGTAVATVSFLGNIVNPIPANRSGIWMDIAAGSTCDNTGISGNTLHGSDGIHSFGVHVSAQGVAGINRLAILSNAISSLGTGLDDSSGVLLDGAGAMDNVAILSNQISRCIIGVQRTVTTISNGIVAGNHISSVLSPVTGNIPGQFDYAMTLTPADMPNWG